MFDLLIFFFLQFRFCPIAIEYTKSTSFVYHVLKSYICEENWKQIAVLMSPTMIRVNNKFNIVKVKVVTTPGTGTKLGRIRIELVRYGSIQLIYYDSRKGERKVSQPARCNKW